MFRKEYGQVFDGDEHWRGLKVPEGDLFRWERDSLTLRRRRFSTESARRRRPCAISRMRACSRCSGDSVTTDHISPAGSIGADTPAGKYLIAHGVQPRDFNSYGARRGNHEVMVRGTFANIRLRNELVPGVEGGLTRASARRRADARFSRPPSAIAAEGVALIVIAGKEYGSG